MNRNGRTPVSWLPGEVPTRVGKSYFVLIQPHNISGGYTLRTTGNASNPGLPRGGGGGAVVDGAQQEFDLSVGVYQQQPALQRKVAVSNLTYQLNDPITVQWNTSAAARCRLAWAESWTPYTSASSMGARGLQHSETLAGLLPHSLYHIRAECVCDGCRNSSGPDTVLVTSAATNLIADPEFAHGIDGVGAHWTGSAVVVNGSWLKGAAPAPGAIRALGGAAQGQILDVVVQQHVTTGVEPGCEFAFSGLVWTHSEGANIYTENQATVKLGIDATGGTNVSAPTVVWSPLIKSESAFTAFLVNDTIPPNSTEVTVFVKAESHSPSAWSVFTFSSPVLSKRRCAAHRTAVSIDGPAVEPMY